MPRTPQTVVVLNPTSGSASHGPAVRGRAAALGYGLRETGPGTDAAALARAAAEAGASTVVAAGGDGTVNEVVRGLHSAEALDSVSLGVLPVGTGNNFAKQLGVTDLDAGFRVLRTGRRRRIDLGLADGRPFVNSCIAGLTADASSETSVALKRRLGVLAYLVTTLRSVSTFESLRLTVRVDGPGTEPAWVGDALAVLVGNGRRFTPRRRRQADMEDGLFDVTVIRDVPVFHLMSDTLIERLLGRESTYVDRFRTPALTIEGHNPEATRFSLEGEIIQQRTLSIRNCTRTLPVLVGDAYTPAPE
ncbi:diacylglycerol/lipid kinase family protein [Haloarcula onubensis]|uniref:YegS/Rv2252/BmrU family lipid kinase n=1 Tax=Haloarcula onubensis TaxID=2950539 RepID=A0ABU2FML8_9EURY|nr:YegS/Rv2252/BmrU family lipid kinase [Halomicroarcula sp. S3CR25-11]MDS0281537.1 YegS/Rv2252/BmrU family lipid kinase [Halomicroarcula sp. S3CR25-11]